MLLPYSIEGLLLLFIFINHVYASLSFIFICDIAISILLAISPSSLAFANHTNATRSLLKNLNSLSNNIANHSTTPQYYKSHNTTQNNHNQLVLCIIKLHGDGPRGHNVYEKNRK